MTAGNIVTLKRVISDLKEARNQFDREDDLNLIDSAIESLERVL